MTKKISFHSFFQVDIPVFVPVKENSNKKKSTAQKRSNITNELEQYGISALQALQCFFFFHFPMLLHISIYIFFKKYSAIAKSLQLPP